MSVTSRRSHIFERLKFEVYLSDLLWCKHVPHAVGAEDETPVSRYIDRVDKRIRLRRNDKDILLGVVAPQVSQGTRYG